MNNKKLLLNRRQFGIATMAGLIAAPSVLRAQAGFPNRPLKLIVPYAPGGATDTVARLVAQRMSDSLGQQIVVENRSGAGGTLGTREGVRAEADGYTILFGNVSTLVLNSLLYSKLNYNPATELKPLALIADVPNVLVVDPAAGVNDVQGLIKLLKANPGKFSYGTPGNGTIMHLSTVLLSQLTGTDVIHVPYRGSMASMQDIMAGRVLMMFDNITGPLALVQGGKLKAIAVSTNERTSVLPDVPTFAEAGVPGFVNKSWFGLCAQANTPAPIARKLEEIALAAIDHPETRKRISELGNIPRPLGSAAFTEFWRSEEAYWKPIVKMANIQLD